MVTCMTDEIWNRRDGESSKAYLAFSAYRRLGVTRSIPRAWLAYRDMVNRQAEGTKAKQLKGNAPSGAFLKWQVTFEWDKRVKAYDTWLDDLVDAREEDIIKQARGRLLLSLGELVERAIELALSGDVTMLRDLLGRARFDEKRRKPGVTDDDFNEILTGVLGDLVEPKGGDDE